MVRDLLTMLGLVGRDDPPELAARRARAGRLPARDRGRSQRLGRRMRKVARQTQTHMGQLTGRLDQTFLGVRQVKADNRERRRVARAPARLIEELFRLNYKAARVYAVSSPIMEVVGGFAVALVILYGGAQVLAGDTTPGAFFSFVAALLFAYRPLKTLANLHTQVQVGLAAAERIYALLDREPTVRDQAGRASR